MMMHEVCQYCRAEDDTQAPTQYLLNQPASSGHAERAALFLGDGGQLKGQASYL